MKCKVTTLVIKVGDVSLSYLGDEVKVSDGAAQAFVDGKQVATLVNARVTNIGDKWIAIGGTDVDFDERRTWWCFLPAEKP